MNTQQLKCFICVADKLNFTRAAEELFLSTSTVTHHIQSLEEEMGTPLFIRNKKSVHLTSAGEVFYNDAKELLERLTGMRKRVNQAAEKSNISLRIGFTTHAESWHVKDCFTALAQKYPDLNIHITVTNYNQLMNFFSNHQLDLVFCSKEMTAFGNDIIFSAFAHKYSMAIMPASCPLSQKESITLSDLEPYRLITYEDRMIPYISDDPVQNWIHTHSLSHPDIKEYDEYSAMTLAASGFGIALLPGFCVPKSVIDSGLCIVKIDGSTEISYGIAYPKKDYNPLIKDILNYFKSKK
ncbi:MAG: LysR family transcriptional regulator [Butyrivibrio sp.]|nr:LysR family transcriptional regulator [Butyrivibrio sp.]